ncbi:MAG: arsenate reductase ArsC [Anaerolineales bacterium]|nr:arsenate reductase ArsC [Anaerolineales bacterium]
MIDHLRKKVLILRTGNSCRSQMAEALINDRLSENWMAYSAGTDPAGHIHSRALKGLSELGIDHQGKSKHINDLPTIEFDLVITICDDAAENCPAWAREGKRVHISIPDPAGAIGTTEDIL